MEFVEYLKIIRARVWIPLLLALFALLVVTGLFLTTGQLWKAQGAMLVQPGAAYRVQWTGALVEVVEESDVWGTLQQLVESRAVAEQAATRAGVPLTGLHGFSFERDKRGNIFKITTDAPGVTQAKNYLTSGMQTVAALWDQTRLQRAEAVRREIQRRGTALAPQREALQAKIAQAEAGPPPGKPTDVLTWTQAQISETQGAIATASVDVGMARDRLNSLNQFATRERSLPPSQRTLGDNALLPTSTAGLQARLMDLQAARSRMLQSRTEGHPEVQALTREIEATQQQIAQLEAQNGPTRNRVSPTLEQQIVLAEAEVRASQRRVDVLRQQESGLRARIPVLQARARNYQQLLDQVEPLEQERQTILANLKTLNSEVTRLHNSEDLRTLDPAEIIGTNKTPQKFAVRAVGALVGGFILGVLLVFLLHYMELGRPALGPEPARVPA